jgi:hypothetical protein
MDILFYYILHIPSNRVLMDSEYRIGSSAGTWVPEVIHTWYPEYKGRINSKYPSDLADWDQSINILAMNVGS